MELYETLAPLYDELFPTAPEASSFLDALASPSRPGARRLFDAGCATGGQALALAALGWEAIGVDSEQAMIAVAERRALREGLSARASFFADDMLGFARGLEGGSFDLVLCLGNTLPHLLGEGAASFLRRARELLAPGGALVLQTLNFSLPGLGVGFAFQDIEARGARMRRSYRAPPELSPEALRFSVELELDSEPGPGPETLRGETLLSPLIPRRIASMLADAGFGSLTRYSSWVGQLFEEVRDIVCIAVAMP
jgi:glycine/sarcosine N-methyltransferase